MPRSRKFMGMGYPMFTNKALCEFTDECTRIKRLEGQPVKIARPEFKLVDTKPIYIKQKGLVPHYTGHVPGELSLIYSRKKPVTFLANFYL